MKRLVPLVLLTVSSLCLFSQEASYLGVDVATGILIPKRHFSEKADPGHSISLQATYEKEFLNSSGAFLVGTAFQKLNLPSLKHSSANQNNERPLSAKLHTLNVPILLKLNFHPLMFISFGPQAMFKFYENRSVKLETDLYLSAGTSFSFNDVKLMAGPYFSTSFNDLGIKLSISHRIK